MNEEMREAEIGVLGSALLQPDKVLGILARWGVTAEWFESKEGRAIATVMLPMHAAGQDIDLLTVSDAMRAAGAGDFYMTLERVLDKTPTAAHAEGYVQMLQRGWMVRAALESATEMRVAFQDGQWTPQDVVARAIGRLTSLVESTGRGVARTSWEVRRDVVQTWRDAASGAKSALGLPWPFEGLNALTQGIYPGLNLIAARPSVGKTMLEGALSRNWCALGLRVARASLDMGVEPLASRDLCALSGESLGKMRGGYMSASDESKIALTLEAMREWREVILEERTSDGIVARARAMAANGGLDVLTVDYAQLLDTGVDARANDNVRISRAMAQLKSFSVTTGVPVVMLSQLSREVEKEGRRPQLSDLRDSGSLEQDAATVTFLYVEPKVSKAWMKSAGVEDVKQLSVKPVVADVLKNQQGGTGSIGLRVHSKWFVMEEAMRTEVYTDDCAMGYDFSLPERASIEHPDVNQYVVAQHPKGAVECFGLQWFREMEKAAKRTGAEMYKQLGLETGVASAVAETMRVREYNRARH